MKEDAEKNINPDTEREILDNTERGCGHLKHGQAYLRSDCSKFGALPSFVEVVTEDGERIPEFVDKEGRTRSWKKWDGVKFEKVHQDKTHYRISPEGYEETGIQNLIASPKTDYSDEDEVPEKEIERHLDRLEFHSEDAEQVGEMLSHSAHDVLMYIGGDYPTPEDFIEEAKRQGVNRAIPPKNMPTVMPGVTRLWFAHPNAVTTEIEQEDGETKMVRQMGIIGYVYLTRVVYTEDEDGKVPNYIQEKEETKDYVDIVEVGEEISQEENREEKGLDKFDTDSDSDSSSETKQENDEESNAESNAESNIENEENDEDNDSEDESVNDKNDESNAESDTEDVLFESERDDVITEDCQKCGASIKENPEGEAKYICMNEMCGKTYSQSEIDEIKE